MRQEWKQSRVCVCGGGRIENSVLRKVKNIQFIIVIPYKTISSQYFYLAFPC